MSRAKNKLKRLRQNANAAKKRHEKALAAETAFAAQIARQKSEFQNQLAAVTAQLATVKELECFRVAVASAMPFRYGGPNDIFNLSVDIDMGSLEYGYLRSSARRREPWQALNAHLEYIARDLSHRVMRVCQDHLVKNKIVI